MRVLFAFLTVGAILVSGSVCAQEIDWQKVDSALGRKPAMSAMSTATVSPAAIFQ